MIGLVITSIIDVSIVKINDLIDKYFIPIQGKLILFAINSSVCPFLQFYLVRHIHISFQRDRLNRTLKVKVLYAVSLISLSVLAGLLNSQVKRIMSKNRDNTKKYAQLHGIVSKIHQLENR
jgi:urease gamma subunit